MTQSGMAAAPDRAAAGDDGGKGESKRVQLAGSRVLVVDDEQLTVRMLDRALRGAGATVSCAHSIEDARALMKASTFDAAVVDLSLAGANGAEIVVELADLELPCAALIITAQRGIDAARAVLAAGAADFLLKPFEIERFVAAVEETRGHTRDLRARPRPSPEERAAREQALEAKVEARARVEEEEDDTLHGDRSRKKRRMLAWPAAPSLELLDINEVADALAKRGDLSERERGVLIHLLRGHRNSEIARGIGAAERTIKFHVANVFNKLHITGRSDLIGLLFKT